ncbi:MAG: PHB depolymerase family esterase [Saprospiraceae bacterium]
MKNCLFILAMVCILTNSNAQQSIVRTIQHNGLTRDYRIYVPASYKKGQAVPLVFNLHGFTSNALQQEFYGDFRPIADTAGFILVHPNGTVGGPSNQTFWNVGFFPSNIDDIGFLEALIDTISAQYSINSKRIYSTGMSNGGFMSYSLACFSQRFAAIASVAGSMTNETLQRCKPARKIPILEVHGTADQTVPYDGSSGFASIPNLLNFWLKINECSSGANDLLIPDIDVSDGATAEHIIFNCPQFPVEHFKVMNGAHTWPGAKFNIGVTCQDFNASEEIWKFFNRYELSLNNEDDKELASIELFPNPSVDELNIQSESAYIGNVKILNTRGEIMTNLNCHNTELKLETSTYLPGVYVIELRINNKVRNFKFVKI